MTRTTSFLVVRHDGHAQTFSMLVPAEIRAEEWARESGRPVEIWSRWTWSLLLVVDPDGTKREPEKPVIASGPATNASRPEGGAGRDDRGARIGERSQDGVLSGGRGTETYQLPRDEREVRG